MVSVVTGQGLGLDSSSLQSIGKQGAIGDASLGRSGEHIIVNGATGNLLLRGQDDVLVKQGLDLSLLHTYNSQGELDDDNGDGWRTGLYRQIKSLTGTLNAAGSTVVRVSGDGSEQTYTYDAGSSRYLSSDGEGAHDTLSYSTSTGKWTWTNGATRSTETYDWGSGHGKLLYAADIDGYGLSYTYNGSLLTQVSDASGETTYLDYDTAAGKTNNLIRVSTYASSSDRANGNAPLDRVDYSYDTANRLSTVSLYRDLDSNGNTLVNSHTYVTTYTYDGSSDRVASVGTSDGSYAEFSYTQQSGSYLVSRIAEGHDHSRVTVFGYDTANSKVTVTLTNADGTQTFQKTQLVYDSQKRLKVVTDLSASGGILQAHSYAYDSAGNLTRIVDGQGNLTVFEYDANGNCTLQRDALGDTITRTYDGANHLLSETHYSAQDVNTTDGILPVGAQTSRYAYDSEGHLRYSISPEGRVKEYIYFNSGNLQKERDYQNDSYTGSSFSENDLSTWASSASRDLTHSTLTTYTYDFRGQLNYQLRFANVDSSGVGSNSSVTQYVYDHAGHLTLKVEPKGYISTGTPATDYFTAYTYDGLGRLITTKSKGLTSTVVYDDANQKVTLTAADGLITTQIFNDQGDLLTSTRSYGTTTYGFTKYVYDAAGQLRMVKDPIGLRSYMLYDAIGRKVADIGPDGSLVEYRYDSDDRIVSTVRYAALLSDAAIASLKTNNDENIPAAISLAAVIPADHTAQVSWNLYDGAGRLAKHIDATGAVTQNSYDGAGNLIKVTRYANIVSLSGINTDTRPSDASVTPATDGQDRYVRYLYDGDGLKIGELDEEGYFSRYVYNAGGQLVLSVDYADAVGPINGDLQVNGDYAAIMASFDATPSKPASDWIKQTYLYDDMGRLVGEVDSERYLTEYLYDKNGNRTQSIRYANKALNWSAAGDSLSNVRPATSFDDRSTVWAYNDDFNRVTTKTDYQKGGSASQEVRFGQASQTQYTYDVDGRLLQTKQGVNPSDLNNTSDVRVQAQHYDMLGNITEELSGTGYALLGTNPTQTQIDNIWANHSIHYTYDNDGHRLTKIDENGFRTLYYYQNGRLVLTLNPQLEIQRNWYDALGRLTDTRSYANRLPDLSGTSNGVTYAGWGIGIISDLNLAQINSLSDAARDIRTSYTYDARGQVSHVTDSRGQDTSKSYDVFGELVSETNALQITTGYAYNRRGLLVRELDDAGHANRQAFQNSYDGFGRLLSVADGNGNIKTSYSYDRLGREIARSDALLQGTTTTYDAFSRKLSVTDRAGTTTSFVYDDATRSVSIKLSNATLELGVSTLISKTSLNVYGQTVQSTDGNGNIVTTEYNADGNVVAVRSAAGDVYNVYMDGGLLVGTTVGHFTGSGYTITGRKTSYGYDLSGRVTQQIVDAGGLNLITRYQYDGQGQQIKVTDPEGRVTTTDHVFNTVTQHEVVTITQDPNGLGLQTIYEYNQAGRKVTVTEGVQASDLYNTPKVTSYQYDNLGRLITQTVDPGAGRLNIATHYLYDGNDNLVQTTDPLGNITRYAYDAGNRLAYQLDALNTLTRYNYDGEGRLTQTRQYGAAFDVSKWNNGNINLITQNLPAFTANGHRSWTVYDKAGQAVYQLDGFGYITERQFDANGNVVSIIRYAKALNFSNVANYSTQGLRQDTLKAAIVTDATDRTTRMIYDAANRVAYTVDADGYASQNSYDDSGNLIATISYTAKPTQLTGTGLTVAASSSDRIVRNYYDAANRQVYAAGPEGSIVQYFYDGSGNVIEERHYQNVISVGSGDTITSISGKLSVLSNYLSVQNSYDAAGRQVWLSHWTSTLQGLACNDSVNYVLDGLGHIRNANGSGTAQKDYFYDAAGRQRYDYTGLNGGNPEVTGTAYDADGRQTLAGHNGVVLHQYTYDALGRVMSDTDAMGATTAYTYDAFGNRTSVQDTYGNFTYYYYDRQNHLTLQVDPAGNAIGYSYDAFGNQTKITRYLNPASGTASVATPPTLDGSNVAVTNAYYDKRNLLTSLLDAAGNTESYSYDGLGNRVSFTNKVLGTTIYTYDKRGLVLTETLPINTQAGSAVVNSYAYDALGNRITTTEALGAAEQRITQYSYDWRGNVLSKTQQAATVGYINASGVFSTQSATPVENRAYDGHGNLLGVQNAYGEWSLSYYDAADRKIADYTAQGIDPATGKSMGSYTTYAYDSNGNMVAVRSYNSLVACPTILFDAPPAIVNSGDYRETRYTYDAMGRQLATLQTMDNVVINGSLQQNAVVAINTNRYDARGNIISTRDGNGNTTYYFYDALGNRTLQIDPLGYGIKWVYGPLGKVTQEIKYSQPVDTTSSLLGMSAEDRKIFGAEDMLVLELSGNSLSDDTPERITDYTYDKMGRLTSQTLHALDYGSLGSAQPGGTDALTPPTVITGAASITYAYDGLGNITRITTAEGGVTDYIYDAMGRQIEEDDAAFTDFGGTTRRTTTKTQYNGLNEVTKQTGMQSNSDYFRVTSYMYGTNGWLIQQTDAEGHVTAYERDVAGNVVRQRQWAVTADWSLSNGNSSAVITNYNPSGTPQNNAGTIATLYRYNSAGQEIWHKDVSSGNYWETGYTAEGEVASQSVNGLQQFLTEYDDQGRVWRTDHEDGVVRAYLYDRAGNATYKMDAQAVGLRSLTAAQIWSNANIARTVSTYDSRNQLISVAEPTFQEAVDTISVSKATYQDTVDAATDAQMTGGVAGGTAQYKVWISNNTLSTYSSNTTLTNPVNIDHSSSAYLKFQVDLSNMDYTGLGKGNYRLDVVSGQNSLSEYYITDTQQIVMGTIDTYGPSQVAASDDALHNGDQTYGSDYKLARQLNFSLWKQLDDGSEILVSTWHGINDPTLSENPNNIYSANASTPMTLLTNSQLLVPTSWFTSNGGDGYTDAAHAALTSGVNGAAAAINRNASTTDLYLSNLPANTQSLKLYYRLKNSSSAWSSIAANQLTTQKDDNWTDSTTQQIDKTDGVGANPEKVFGINLPSGLAANDYEFYYVANDGNGNAAAIARGSFNWAGGKAAVREHTPYSPDWINRTDRSSVQTFTLPWDTANTISVAARDTAKDILLRTVTATDTATVNIIRSQTYNAFGEVASVFDGTVAGMANQISYTYNAMGKLVSEVDGAFFLNGDTNNSHRSTTSYVYDREGRNIGTKDAYGRWTLQSWVNAGGRDQVAVQQFANGGRIIHQYDMLGNERKTTDQLNNVTTQVFDKLGELTQVNHAGGLVDNYFYDQAGRRIGHTQTADGIRTSPTTVLNNVTRSEVWDYDSLGRVTQATDYAGRNTSYEYAWTNLYNYAGGGYYVTGTSNQTIGGWQTTTTDANGRSQITIQDTWGREDFHQDLGGRQFRTVYDRDGEQVYQFGTNGKYLYTEYYANGYVKRQLDRKLIDANGKSYWGVEQYRYDSHGNRTGESYSEQWKHSNAATGSDWVIGGYYGPRFFEDATLTYDALNRLIKSTDAQTTISYAYDAVGNRSQMNYTYTDLLGTGANLNQQFRYTYDAMNRILTQDNLSNDGASINTVTLSSQGLDADHPVDDRVSIQYDLAGNRTQVVYGIYNRFYTENYTYNDANLLTQVQTTVNGSHVLATRAYDGFGRVNIATDVTTYKNATDYNDTQKYLYYDYDNAMTKSVSNGRVMNAQGNLVTKRIDTTFNRYLKDGTLNFTLTQSNTNNAAQQGLPDSGGEPEQISTTRYVYDWWDSAQQHTIHARSVQVLDTDHNNQPRAIEGSATRFRYDVNGNAAEATDVDANRNYVYSTDSQGMTYKRRETYGSATTYHSYAFANGQQIGDFGTDRAGTTQLASEQSYSSQMGASGVDQWHAYRTYKPVLGSAGGGAFQAIDPDFPSFAPSSYTVVAGDTLQSIASKLWGDASIWFLIADANAEIVGDGGTLADKTVLVIPNQVVNVHNNSQTFKPYSATEALGDTSPSIPPPPVPKGEGCSPVVMVLVMVVAAVAAFFTAGAVLGLLGAGESLATTTLTATAAGGLEATSTAAFTVTTSASLFSSTTLASAVAAGVGGAVGSVVSQGLGMAIGTQNKFSWKGVATSALTSMVGSAVGSALDGVGLKPDTSGLNGASRYLANFGVGVLRNAVTQTATQGLLTVTGMQKRMDWGGIATGVVASSAAQVGANAIGSNFKFEGTLLENADQSTAWLNVASHALLGAGVATIRGQDAASGAFGGTIEAGVGGLVENLFDVGNMQDDTELRSAVLQVAVAGLADVFGMDSPQTAAAAADNAYRYNRRLHASEVRFIKDQQLDRKLLYAMRMADLQVPDNAPGPMAMLLKAGQYALDVLTASTDDKPDSENTEDAYDYEKATEKQKYIAEIKQFVSDGGPGMADYFDAALKFMAPVIGRDEIYDGKSYNVDYSDSTVYKLPPSYKQQLSADQQYAKNNNQGGVPKLTSNQSSAGYQTESTTAPNGNTSGTSNSGVTTTLPLGRTVTEYPNGIQDETGPSGDGTRNVPAGDSKGVILPDPTNPSVKIPRAGTQRITIPMYNTRGSAGPGSVNPNGKSLEDQLKELKQFIKDHPRKPLDGNF